MGIVDLLRLAFRANPKRPEADDTAGDLFDEELARLRAVIDARTRSLNGVFSDLSRERTPR